MSDLIVIGFPDEFKADEVLIDLRRLELNYLINLEDAAIVVRNQDSFKKSLVSVNCSDRRFYIRRGNANDIKIDRNSTI